MCVVWLVGKNDKSANKIIKFDAIWLAKKIKTKIDQIATTDQIFFASMIFTNSNMDPVQMITDQI